MTGSTGPWIWGLLALVAATALGAGPVRKFIEVREAQTELRRGSAGAARTVRGWSLIAVWAVATWFAGTFVGDWGATGDLDGATERAMVRLEWIVLILALIMEADT